MSGSRLDVCLRRDWLKAAEMTMPPTAQQEATTTRAICRRAAAPDEKGIVGRRMLR